MADDSSLLYDLGFERAEAVFTTFLARGEALFHFEEDHYPRLIDGCRAQKIDVGRLPSFEAMHDKIVGAIQMRRLEYTELVVKLFITPGVSSDGITSDGAPQFFVTIRPFVRRASGPFRLEIQRGGRKFPYEKVVGQYTFVRRRIAEAKTRGFDEFLYANAGEGITESPYRNIFFVQRARRKLITPTVCLHGVTRSIVLDHTKDWAGIECIEEAPTIFSNRLPSFDEAFLTSSTAGIIPVSYINHGSTNYLFQAGTSTIAEQIRRMYFEYREQYFKDRGA